MTALLDAALQTTVLAGAGLLAAACLRRSGAAVRHATLAAFLAAGAIAPLLAPLVPAWSIPLRAVDTTLSSLGDAPLAPVDTGAETASATVGASARPPWLPQLGVVLIIVWLAGVVVHGTRLVRSLTALAHVPAASDSRPDERLMTLLSEAARVVGLERVPRLVVTRHADLLATWGVRRPWIALPDRATNWEDERLRLVLVHECAHVRRKDWAVQVAAQSLRALHWFNPLIHIACRRLRQDSERACDDVVMERGTAADRYAEHLLAIARESHHPAVSWSSAVSIASIPGLERRITAMLNPHLNRRPLTRTAMLAIVGLALAVALPVAALHSAQAQDDLRGTVYDVTGAVVPEVALTLEDQAGPIATTTTDAAGTFEFPAIRAGEYTLTAKLPGFQQLQQRVTLAARPDWDRAIILQLGTVSESIRVSTNRTVPAEATDAAPAPTPIRVGGNIRAPRKTHDVKPVYPSSMRDAGREGTVALEAIIGRDGLVHSLRVLGAHVHPDFAIAAAEAARQWRFTPTLLNGEPVDVMMNVSVEFRLDD